MRVFDTAGREHSGEELPDPTAVPCLLAETRAEGLWIATFFDGVTFDASPCAFRTVVADPQSLQSGWLKVIRRATPKDAFAAHANCIVAFARLGKLTTGASAVERTLVTGLITGSTVHTNRPRLTSPILEGDGPMTGFCVRSGPMVVAAFSLPDDDRLRVHARYVREGGAAWDGRIPEAPRERR
jgi:hypothetical protein